MKNKKFFLQDRVKITIMLAVMGFGSVYGMDLCKLQLSQIDRTKAAQGFLSTSFFNTSQLTMNLSHEAKIFLRKKIIHKEDKSLVTLFNIATQLPPELQKHIVLRLLDNNTTQAHKFIHKPLIYSLERYMFSQQIIEGLRLKMFTHNAAHESGDLKSILAIDIVFEHLNNLVTVDKLLQLEDRQYVYTSKELAIIEKVAKAFPSIGNQELSLSFAYRDSYTLSNILEHIRPLQLEVLLILAMACMSAFIEQKLCSKILMQHLVDQNKCTIVKNVVLMAKFQETGELFWLENQSNIVDPLRHSWLNYIKIIAPNLFVPVPGIIMNEKFFWKKNLREILVSLKDDKLALLSITALGIVPLVIFKAIFYCLSCISPIFDDQLLIHGSLLGAYIIGCLFFNLARMSKTKYQSVKIDHISDLLNNKDIVIS